MHRSGGCNATILTILRRNRVELDWRASVLRVIFARILGMMRKLGGLAWMAEILRKQSIGRLLRSTQTPSLSIPEGT